MRNSQLGLLGLLICVSLVATGCFLNVYQTARTVTPAELAFWWGLGALFSPFEGLSPQLHVRYGLMPRLDLGLGSGFSINQSLQDAKFLGVVGDLRYQVHFSPDITLGLIPGSFPFFGDVLSGGAVYVSQSFGSLTPYGSYRFWLLLKEGDLALSHQATIGIEVFNRPRLPAIFELTWKDGRLMFGFAIRL